MQEYDLIDFMPFIILIYMHIDLYSKNLLGYNYKACHAIIDI